MSHIQAVIFRNNIWTSDKSRNWLKRNKLMPIKRVHKTKKFLRYRITQPNYKKYKYRIKRLKGGVNLILGFKLKK